MGSKIVLKYESYRDRWLAEKFLECLKHNGMVAESSTFRLDDGTEYIYIKWVIGR